MNIIQLLKKKFFAPIIRTSIKTQHQLTRLRTKQLWLVKSQRDLNTLLREEHDIPGLTRQTLKFITHYINTQTCCLYLSGPDGVLNYAGSESVTKTKDYPQHIQLNEELVGACAQKRVSINQGQNQWAFPLLSDDQLVGVIELESSTEITFYETTLLNTCTKTVAIAISNAIYQAQLQLSNEELKIKAEVLQLQKAELERTKNQLAKSESLYRSLFENAEEFIFVLKSNGTIAYVNDAAVQKLKCPAHDFLQKPFTHYLKTSSQKLFNRHFKKLNQESYLHLDLQLISEHIENPILTESSLSTIRAQNNRILNIVIIQRDITQKRQIEEQEKKLIDQKSHFISMVTHELRTPVAVIGGSIELVLNGDLGPVQPLISEYLSIAQTSIVRLTKLINQTLDYHKLSLNKMHYQKVPYNIYSLIQNCYDSLKILADQKNLDFSIPAKTEPIILFIDKDKIEQVLINLIGNAIKYTDKGSIKIYTQETKKLFSIHIEDTGIGIQKSNLPHLFKPFFQENHQKNTSGTGLGLAISHQIIKDHGGTISVKSTLEIGSKFTINLENNA